MSEAQTEHALWVVESNGAPRSGKGTITSGLTDMFAGAAQDETGADYRAVTHSLLAEELIDPEMTKEQIEKVVGKLGSEPIAEYAASRHDIETPELYTPWIGDTVSKVSPHDIVRSAVKQGFARRVEKVVNDDDIRLLFVDGRNLTPVIRKVKGADLLLRLFVDCQPFIGAHREGERDPNIDPGEPGYEDWYLATVESIRKRQRDDEQRPHDPAKKEETAIDYWFNNDVLHETGLHLAASLDTSFSEVVRMLATGRNEDYRRGGRYGAGAKATAENRQVYFDTSEIGRDPMIQLAHRMVEEALDQRANRYQPHYSELIRI